MSKSITSLITLKQNTSSFSKAGEITHMKHFEKDLEIVQWNPIYKLSGDPLFSMFSNADSLPFVELLKKPSEGNRPARYLAARVSNGGSVCSIDLSDIGAVAGVSQTDRDVLADLFETVLYMMTTSNPLRPQETNGFKITKADKYIGSFVS